MENKTATHLYRGAPPVRSWSRYQETDQHWSLCGSRVKANKAGDFQCTEVAKKVTCRYCLQLMRPYDRKATQAEINRVRR